MNPQTGEFVREIADGVAAGGMTLPGDWPRFGVGAVVKVNNVDARIDRIYADGIRVRPLGGKKRGVPKRDRIQPTEILRFRVGDSVLVGTTPMKVKAVSADSLLLKADLGPNQLREAMTHEAMAEMLRAEVAQRAEDQLGRAANVG